MTYTTKIIDFIIDELDGGASLLKDSPFYEGNPSIRRGNVEYSLSEWEKEEIIKSNTDIFYLISQYCKIPTEHGASKVKLYEHQTDLLKLFNDNTNVVGMLARQTGKTLVESLYMVSLILKGKTTVIFSNTGTQSVEVLEKIKSIYSELPFWMKPGVLSWNKHSITFDNGARIRCINGKSAAIGFKCDSIVVNEAAHISELERILSAIMDMDTQIILLSTPNGFNKFYKIWDDALKGKNNFAIYI